MTWTWQYGCSDCGVYLGYGDPDVLNTGCDEVLVAEPQDSQGLWP